VENIRAGIVGCGFIGRIHIEALRRLGFVEVTALASHNQDVADKKSKEMSIPKAYGSWKDLVHDDEVDIVHINTTNELHYPIAKECISAGKHVLCEKPLAMNATESAELLEMARRSGVVHALCHNMRYYPLVKQARAMVQAGELGEIRLVHGHYMQDWLFLETDYNWRLVSELSGASRAVGDVGTHWLDMVQHVTGQRVVSVYADITTFIPVRKKPVREVETYTKQEMKPEDYTDVEIDTEDHATIILKFSGGAKGVVLVCQVCAGRKNYVHFEINGSKRSIEWCGEKPNHMWIGERGKVNAEFIKNPAIMDAEAARYAGAPCGLGEGYLDTFRSIFSDLYGWIRDGRAMDDEAAPFPTFLTGHEELSIVEAVLKSAKTGTWTDVSY
jgi:predicted dehydrogenase